MKTVYDFIKGDKECSVIDVVRLRESIIEDIQDMIKTNKSHSTKDYLQKKFDIKETEINCNVYVRLCGVFVTIDMLRKALYWKKNNIFEKAEQIHGWKNMKSSKGIGVPKEVVNYAAERGLWIVIKFGKERYMYSAKLWKTFCEETNSIRTMSNGTQLYNIPLDYVEKMNDKRVSLKKFMVM